MRTIHFGMNKLILGTLAGVLLPMVGIPMLAGGTIWTIAGLIFIVAGPLASASSIKRLLGDRVALAYDARQVRIATAWSSETFLWSQVRGVGTSQLVTRMYGFIPVNRQHFIDLKVEGGMFGSRTIRLAVAALEIGKRDLDSLVGDMQLAHAGQAPAAPQAASARARGRDPLEGAPRSDAFDADAALAHYLANRSAEPEAPPAAPASRPRPTFGRKVA